MEWAKKGAAALAGTDQAADALVYYTKALIESPTSPDYLTQRAAAFSRLKPARHDLALRDTEYAILLAQKRAKREKIQAAQQRRVVALYGLGRYEEAKQLLDSMLRWRPKDSKVEKMEHDMWMAKITSKLKNKDNSSHLIKEYPEIELPNEASLKAWFQGQLDTDGKYRLDGDAGEATNITSEADTTSDDVLSKDELAAAKAAPPKSILPIRHDFYQNNDNLIVTFYAKKVDPGKFDYKLESNELSLSFPHPDDQETTFTYSAIPTFAAIDTSKSKYKVFGTKIELTLAKEDKGLKWPSLQATNQTVPTKLPSPYVTKSKDGEDWDKRAAEITKKTPKKSETSADKDGASDIDSDDGGDVVDGFFKKLYKDADDDTRKAMMKSFQESNGTSLSTNWKEVSKGKVEPVRSKDD